MESSGFFSTSTALFLLAELIPIVRTWLYGSVSDSHHGRRSDGARTLARHSQQVLGEPSPPAIFLSEDFHSMTRVTSSSWTLKEDEVGCRCAPRRRPPCVHTHVGFESATRYQPQVQHHHQHCCQLSTRNNSFQEALDQFALKELRLSNEVKITSSIALVASITSNMDYGSSSCSSSSAGPQWQ